MRTFFRTFLAATLALTASAVSAQDPGMQAAQMASQQATQMANQQAMQASQQANQQAMQNAQIDSEVCPACTATAAPKFSLAPGAYPASTIVRLKTRSRSAHIFYTTDGWTPTPQSTPYTGPIALTQTETIQAIAISPGAARSSIAKAEYTVPSSAPATAGPSPTQLSPTSIELPQNTPLQLVFTTRLDSQTANIGDVVPLALASDLVVNGVVIAPKGTPAQAKVTAVDPAAHVSVPGAITFSLVSIKLNGVGVTLAGTKTKEGEWHKGRQAFLLIPLVGATSILKHGDPAEIAPNTQVTGLVAANTEIPARPATP
jgi:hypothetical protein